MWGFPWHGMIGWLEITYSSRVTWPWQCLVVRARMAYVAWKGSKSYASDHDSGASAVGDIFGICWTRKKHYGPQLFWKVMDSHGFLWVLHKNVFRFVCSPLTCFSVVLQTRSGRKATGHSLRHSDFFLEAAPHQVGWWTIGIGWDGKSGY